jgi:hypothetical protein
MVETKTEILQELDKELLKHLEDLALYVHKATGEISPELLDMIIKYRGIKLDAFKDKQSARELWHNLITLSLINPSAYKDALDYIKHTGRKLGIDTDIPDIVA